MGKHLVLVGGGHAHMVTLANIHAFIGKGHRVTVIGPSDYHYYSGMGPGMLGGTYTPEEIRFRTRHVVEKQGGIFVNGKAVRVEPAKKQVILESGDAVSYDVVSFNAGSHVPESIISGKPDDIYFVKPIERLMEAGKRILELTRGTKTAVGIVGGGPSSAEVAGNIWQLVNRAGHEMPDIRIFAGNRFMPRFPEVVRQKVMKSIRSRGIEIIEQGYVDQVKTGEIRLASGRTWDAGLIFMALGVQPSSMFESSGIPVGPDRGMLVNRYLQSVAFPEFFGGGDCIHFQEKPLDKVGVYAVRENPVLFKNLMAFMEGQPLTPFDPGGDYLLIFNLGNREGVLKKRWLTFGGSLAFKIKDYIDRKFMTEFQAIE